ncbi:hypothetical protein M153_1756000926 [Pseudoloma neurophilia]|uniref:Uncharacterized protein n=1 Tax=Pseudoloma neurophilia TaxID=146866 RepID=A0A0R0M081_9MICR|nr:hypothetical protein M153_1756000926 [Pseudoloma neurophilia]
MKNPDKMMPTELFQDLSLKVTEIDENVEEKIGEIIEKESNTFVPLIYFIFGLYLNVVGLKTQKISICMFFILFLMFFGLDFIKGLFLKMSIDLGDLTTKMTSMMEQSIGKGLGHLVLLILISLLIIYIVKIAVWLISIGIMIAIGYFLYSTGIFLKLFEQFQIDPLVGHIILGVIFLVIVYFAYNLIQNLIFLLAFTGFGSLTCVCGADQFFNLGFGSSEFIQQLTELNFDFESATFVTWVGTGCFGLGTQLLFVFDNDKK